MVRETGSSTHSMMYNIKNTQKTCGIPDYTLLSFELKINQKFFVLGFASK
jgi:hypothetical protein